MSRVRITPERRTTTLIDMNGDIIETLSYLVWSADCPTCGDRAGSIHLPEVHKWANWHGHRLCTPAIQWRKR